MKRKHRRAKGVVGQSSPPPPVTRQQVLDEAVRHHQSGRLAEAEALYRQILAKNSRHADALHLLGVIALQTGGYDGAIDFIQKAIEIDQTVAAYHSNLGNALNKLGRRTEALAAFDSALRIQPGFADGHYNRGNTLKDLGRPEEALAAYKLAICLSPDFAFAYLNRGTTLTDLDRLHEAVRAFGTAIRIQPDSTDAHSNRGNVLKELGCFDAAISAYNAALSLRPDSAEAHNNRGNAMKDLGRPAEALASYATALAVRPDYADAHYNSGIALHDLGRCDDAVASYDAALRLQPDFAEAHSNRGNALKDLGRLAEALASYAVALRLKPDFDEVHSNRGNALRDLGRLDDAQGDYDAAVSLRPNFAEAHSNRGNALRDLGRRDDALAAYDTALKVRPDFAEAHSNRGNALKDRDRHQDALTSYGTALSLSPDYAEAHYNRGIALHELGRLDEALSAYDSALKVRPDYAEAHYNVSLCRLLRGEFSLGWDKYEWRWRGVSKTLRLRGFTQPRWQGEGFAGKTILLHAEQGFGDTIQFCRYAPLVAERGGQVVLEAPHSLIGLLSGLKGVDRLVAAGDPLPGFDLHCPLMSLPAVFGTTVDSIPADVPYLSAKLDRVERWRRHVGSQGLKIGVVWQGNPASPVEKGRSAPLAAFASLARLPGVRLISLQKVHGLDQLTALPIGMRVETLGADFDAGPDAFLDTAAVMMSLDLIVTTDTSVAHLAGSLGRPTWIALSCLPEWRWMLERDDSPWYPSVQLFRQTERGDWQGLFARMAAGLASRLTNKLADSPGLSG